MSVITNISVDQSGTVSALIDGSKVELDIHVLLMKVLANSRRRLTTQYLDEVNEMNKVNNKANMYRDIMEELRKAKTSGSQSIHYYPTYVDLLRRLESKYGKDMVKESGFNIMDYGSSHHRFTEHFSQSEWNDLKPRLDAAGFRNISVSGPAIPGYDVKASWDAKSWNKNSLDSMIEDLRHKITSMNNMNSQNQIKVKMVEQFRNETIEWQKSLLDKLDRLFQKVNQ